MGSLSITQEIKEEGFELSFSFKNNIHTVTAFKDGIAYIRKGLQLDKCIESLRHDIKK